MLKKVSMPQLLRDVKALLLLVVVVHFRWVAVPLWLLGAVSSRLLLLRMHRLLSGIFFHL